MIVTKTDLKGLLTYTNDVFLNISGLDEGEALGQPHNVIRHPDMPRCIFKLLWDTLGAGEEIFAYVLNLATDGAHYWVFAHVTPSTNQAGKVVGYHSNRRVPEQSAVATITDLYARLRSVERSASRPAEGLTASDDLLRKELLDRGQTYDEYVWSITPLVQTAGGR